MTTTIVHRPAPAPAPQATPPRGRRFGALLIAALVAGSALAGARWFGSSTQESHGTAMMHKDPLPADVGGTYRLDDGTHLTLYGTVGMPSYELSGERVMLRAVDKDLFEAWDDPDEVLTVRRNPTGEVTGVSLVRDGEESRFAARDPLYFEEDITFENSGVKLAGSIALPEGEGPHPGVVLVHGAEAATRDSYTLIASHLARRGVAALTYDKRGVGESEGSYTGATFEDLTGDALAGLEVLRRHPAIDPGQVGMAGFSQGGWIIAMAAERSEDVAFVIPVSASGFTPGAQARWLDGNQLLYRGLGSRTIDTSEKAWRMLVSNRDLVDAGLMPAIPQVMGFWFHALDPNLDTAGLWERVKQPVLGIWGELDCQVPARDSLEAIRTSLERGGNRNYTLRILPGADHGITLVGPCAQETTGWSVTRVAHAEGYLGSMAEWVKDLPAGDGRPVREIEVPAEATPSQLAWHQSPERGVAWFGSFLPQLATILVLVILFAAIGLLWLGRRIVAALMGRGRPARDPLGALAFSGLAAMVIGLAALYEILLLSDASATLLIGGPTPFGVSIAFIAASVAAVVAVGLGVRMAVQIVRAKRSETRVERIGVRGGLVLGAMTMFTAWVMYWNILPIPGIG